MADSGSRTPLHYGSMTPLHDGSRTPNASSEWDPSISNTYPSPGYNPSKSCCFFLVFFLCRICLLYVCVSGTPGYQMSGPFTPQTPGGTIYDAGYSPYQPSPGYQSITTLFFNRTQRISHLSHLFRCSVDTESCDRLRTITGKQPPLQHTQLRLQPERPVQPSNTRCRTGRPSDD